MTELLEAARAWIEDVHPHPHHLVRTLEWVAELDPAAGETLRIAAVTHDSERAYPDPDCPWDSANDFAAPGYLRYHQDRCAEITAGWLHAQTADDELVARVSDLVAAHELGGWPEADLLQAADSLSFLETMVPLVSNWITSGRAPAAIAEAKLRWMHERIGASLPRARKLAQPLLQDALARLSETSRSEAPRST